jgi:steroid delta-isomerase-like uncharacterized protein
MSDASAIAREYLEAWNRRDWETFRGVLHPEYSYTGGDGEKQQGPEAGLAVGQMFANAFTDGKIELRKISVAGDVAVVEFIGRGTHDGDLMGIAPTGRQMELPICTVLEIRDGKIHTEREYMDMLHLMQQLGVAPAPATA